MNAAPLLHVPTSEWAAWHLHPDALVLVAGMLIAYWYAVVVWRPHLAGAEPVSRTQMAFYLSGVLVVYIAAGSPVHDISEKYLLSFHMTQHLMFTLVAPPLLLAGIPTWLWSALLGGRRVMPVARVALHPLVAIFTFNMVLVITHLPHVVNFALETHWFHFVVHVVLVATAVQMWWPIVTRVPGMPSLTYPYQMAYLFVQSLVPSVIGAFITFSHTAVYSFYETQPRLWGIDPVEDQQMGAFVMKVVGSLILWGFIGVAFFKWFEREESKAGEPAWFEVEDELKQLGISTK